MILCANKPVIEFNVRSGYCSVIFLNDPEKRLRIVPFDAVSWIPDNVSLEDIGLKRT